MKKRFLIVASCLAVLPLVALLVSGCSQVDQIAADLGLGGLLPQRATPGAILPGETQVLTATQQAEAEITITPNPPQVLTIWVPPEFAPDGGSLAGRLLEARLESFVEENPQVAAVEVRVKAIAGPSNLLDSLAAANAAAPDALPSLVALRRTDLETAALKGLIYAMDDLTSIIDGPDWYPYAEQMALIQGSVYGLPFAGDALLLVYRPAAISAAPRNWEELLDVGKPLLFPLADPQAVVTLAMYQSAGGSIRDTQNRPVLDAAVLAQVLTVFQKGTQKGVFPVWLAEYATDGQAWQGYQERRADWMITWSARYLGELPVDTAAMPFPSLGEDAFTLASGWSWALADPNPERQELSKDLAEYLVDTEFLTTWAEPSGYLPTRPSTLASWSNQSLRSLINQIVLSAVIRPSTDLVSSLGPVLEESALQVIQYKAIPETQAQTASERLAIPELNK